jgi:hypothetical protein
VVASLWLNNSNPGWHSNLLLQSGRSPDLAPLEMMWAWLRKHLRAMDLKDAIAKRPILGKTAYGEHVRRILKIKKAQQVGKNIANSLHKSCRMVLKAKGAAIRG